MLVDPDNHFWAVVPDNSKMRVIIPRRTSYKAALANTAHAPRESETRAAVQVRSICNDVVERPAKVARVGAKANLAGFKSLLDVSSAVEDAPDLLGSLFGPAGKGPAARLDAKSSYSGIRAVETAAWRIVQGRKSIRQDSRGARSHTAPISSLQGATTVNIFNVLPSLRGGAAGADDEDSEDVMDGGFNSDDDNIAAEDAAAGLGSTGTPNEVSIHRSSGSRPDGEDWWDAKFRARDDPPASKRTRRMRRSPRQSSPAATASHTAASQSDRTASDDGAAPQPTDMPAHDANNVDVEAFTSVVFGEAQKKRAANLVKKLFGVVRTLSLVP